MANKKINELDSRASLSLSDLMAVGDPSTGYLYKTTISDLKTLTGAGVISFNGRFGSVVPVEGDYALTQLSDVIITSASNNNILKYNGSNWVNVPMYTGTIAQYVDGTGAYQTFPTLLSSDRLITEVRNQSGATMTKGTVIYLNGSSGTLPLITKAQANSETTSSSTFGVVQNDIANNTNGYVVVIGTLVGLDTSAYTAGDILWLSPTVAGGMTATKPIAPNNVVYVGIVTRSNNSQGTIEVKIQNGYELDELHNVLITSVANNDALVYETSSSLWKNKPISTLSTDTLDSVTGRGNTTANSITVGSVSAAGLSNLLGQLRTFATTGNVYIGANPSTATDAGYKLDVNGTIRATSTFYGTQILTGAHSFRNETYITATTDGYTKQNGYNGTNAYTMGFIGDLRFAPSTTVKAVFSFNGSYSNNGTIYSGDSSLVKIFTGDAMGNTIGSTNINGYGINLMPTLNYTTGTSNFTGIYYNPTLTATTGLTHYAMNLVAGLVKMGTLAGTGTRLVVTDANGVLSAQTIPSLSGYVTLDTTQSITGSKTFASATFTGAPLMNSGVLLSITTSVSASGYTALGGLTDGLRINLENGTSNHNLYLPTTASYNYTFPAASGTIALTSDISGYLPLAGGTLTGALNGTSAVFSSTFQSSGYYLTGMTAGNGALYYTANRLTLANYNVGGGLEFEVNGGTYALSIASTGNVGIGTQSPVSITNYKGLTLNGTNGAYTYWNINGTDTGRIITDSASFYIDNVSTGAIVFRTTSSSTERMRITSAGNVGIGTTAPVSISGFTSLEVKGSSSGLIYVTNASTQAGHFYVNSGGVLIGASSNDPLVLNTNNTERMRITSGGTVLVNATAVLDASAKFQTNGNVYLGNQPAGAGTGTLKYNASTGLVSYDASARIYKKEIIDLEYGLDSILKMSPKKYKWKSNDDIDLGFIADEMYSIIPEIVFLANNKVNETELKDGEPMGINYDRIVPVLVKAIQELKAEIDILKA